jgi:archaemetzincin
MVNNRRMVRTLACLVVILAAGGTAHADESGYTVCVQPLGKYDKKLLAPLERGIESIMGFTVQRLDPRPMPEDAWYEPRKRWRADTILDWIRSDVWPESGCGAVIAFTSADISTTNGEIEDWGIFGLGEIDGVACVVSSKRLARKAKKKKLIQRVVKVAIHELGHVIGMPHRDGVDPECMMNDAGGTIKTVDAERGLPCADERTFVEEKLGVTMPALEAADWGWIATGK